MIKSGYSIIIVIFWGFVFLLSSCSTLDRVASSRDLDILLKKSNVFKSQFSGFMLYDPQEKSILKSKNASNHFTPASNTKILTAFACLSSLNDSIPTFLIENINDTTHIAPFGDPSFLHPDFAHQTVLNYLKGHPITIHLPSDIIQPFGPGWAWDDYQYSFQPERAWMPIYANEVRIAKQDSLTIRPTFFQNYVQVNYGIAPTAFNYRHVNQNIFNIWIDNDSLHFKKKIPFQYSRELLSRLLSDTTQNHVSYSTTDVFKNSDTIFNNHILPVLSTMMLRSDNFLAEQLLIVCAAKSGFRNIDSYRNHLLNHWNLSDKIQWVDGCGLSRYNLITPRAFVEILEKIYQTTSWSEIEMIFPIGGVSGTIKNWYKSETPYVFAKTGTLSNNHCLSGYIKTKSGRTLIFSFMNNNYLHSVDDVRNEMQKALEIIKDGY